MKDIFYNIYYEDVCVAEKVPIDFVVPFIRAILSEQNCLPSKLMIKLVDSFSE